MLDFAAAFLKSCDTFCDVFFTLILKWFCTVVSCYFCLQMRLISVHGTSHQQSPIFAREYVDKPGGKNFVDMWLYWAIFHSNSAVISQYYKPAFDWIL
jgi:hypothetical protein